MATEPAASADALPGLAVVGVAAGTSAWLAEHYGFPIILLGLLIGLAGASGEPGAVCLA